MLPNLPQTIISYYGILKAGGVMVSINPYLGSREVEHIIANCRAGIIIGHNLSANDLLKVKNRTGLKGVIFTDIRRFYPFRRRFFKEFIGKTTGYYRDVKSGGDIYSFWNFIRKYPTTPTGLKINMDDNAVIQYTGGITGISKGATLTHKNISSNVEQVYIWFKNILGTKDRVIAAIPYSHLYGMTVALDLPIRVGATIIVINRFTAKKFVETTKNLKPTFFPSIPSMYRSIIQQSGLSEVDFSSIKLSVSMSAPLSEDVREEFKQKTGIDVVEGYGLAEASGVTHMNPPTGGKKAGTMGLPLPDTEAKIVDIESDGRILGPGDVGELVISGPQIMRGYWAMPEETGIAIRDGMLYTGDIAKMDEEGFFTLVERKKNVIFVGENRVYPREIEEILLRHHSITDATVVGIPDKLMGEAVKAFVVLEEGKVVSGEDIMRYCKNNMATCKVPVEVEFLKELTKTDDGKIIRKEVAGSK